MAAALTDSNTRRQTENNTAYIMIEKSCILKDNFYGSIQIKFAIKIWIMTYPICYRTIVKFELRLHFIVYFEKWKTSKVVLK